MTNRINHQRSKSNRILACFATVLIATLGLASSQAQNATTPPASTDTTTTTTTTATNDQNSSSTPPANEQTLSHADRHFIMKAAMASSNELALSQLAADHASNPQVKSFAQDMITAHQQLNSDLQTLAGQKNVDITKPVEKGQKDEVDSLSKKMGQDFDHAYVKQMVKGHEEAVSLFKKESEDGKDPDVTALANKYLSVVSDHLQHAKTLKQTIEQ